MYAEYPGFISYTFPDGSIRSAHIRVVFDGMSACCYVRGDDGPEIPVPAGPIVAGWMFEAINAIASLPAEHASFDLVLR